MSTYTLFDHTADIGIEIRARTKKELFRRAALALSHVLTGMPAIDSSGARQQNIYAEGADTEDLLVNFLREILYVLNGKNLFLCDCRIEKGGHRKLLAVLHLGQSEERPQLEIKAVTYHGLQIAREKSGWVARVIFDV